MSVVKRVVMLLLLAALGTNAVPGPEDCDGLNITLPTKDLHKTFGDWALVWGITDNAFVSDLLANLSSSHLELHLLPDNHTIQLVEGNLFHNSCTKYFFNMTVPSDSDHHSIHIGAGTMLENGVVSQFNHSGEVEFFETCPDCLMMVYRGLMGRYLLSYRREGHHQDVEQQKAAHSDLNKLSECLGLPHDKPFTYDGAAEFCHKESSPEVTSEQS